MNMVSEDLQDLFKQCYNQSKNKDDLFLLGGIICGDVRYTSAEDMRNLMEFGATAALKKADIHCVLTFYDLYYFMLGTEEEIKLKLTKYLYLLNFV